MKPGAAHGLDLTASDGMTRINLGCEHQHGLVYFVPAEMSWVCSQERMPGHALAGFLRELTAVKDERVTNLMQRWGIYYRPLPLEEDAGSTDPAG